MSFKKVFNSLKTLNYRMFLALLVFGLIPTLYTTFRIYLIGQLPDAYAFSIAGQLQWINVIYEIIQETLILPLFFFIGAVMTNKEALRNRIRTGLLFAFSIYTVLSVIIMIFAKPLTIVMA